MKFTSAEEYDFKEAYENENDDLMVKCPWCPNEQGCHPDICNNMVGYGDGERVSVTWHSEHLGRIQWSSAESGSK